MDLAGATGRFQTCGCARARWRDAHASRSLFLPHVDQPSTNTLLVHVEPCILESTMGQNYMHHVNLTSCWEARRGGWPSAVPSTPARYPSILAWLSSRHGQSTCVFQALRRGGPCCPRFERRVKEQPRYDRRDRGPEQGMYSWLEPVKGANSVQRKISAH